MNTKQHAGFTLIELMIVVAIIGVLAAIAYPSYQQYIIKSKRADMMSELHNIASEIQARKLAQGKYDGLDVSDLQHDFPQQGDAYYAISISFPLTSDWIITAAPISNTQMTGDGDLTLNYQGIKCHKTNCGTGDEWR